MSSATNPGRFAGWLYILTSIFGFFAMGYVPDNLIVHGNAAATASNILAHETLFRLGIAAELIGMAGFIFVADALYDLLKGVNRRHASLMVTLIVVSVPIAFVNELNSESRPVYEQREWKEPKTPEYFGDNKSATMQIEEEHCSSIPL